LGLSVTFLPEQYLGAATGESVDCLAGLGLQCYFCTVFNCIATPEPATFHAEGSDDEVIWETIPITGDAAIAAPNFGMRLIGFVPTHRYNRLHLDAVEGADVRLASGAAYLAPV